MAAGKCSTVDDLGRLLSVCSHVVAQLRFSSTGCQDHWRSSFELSFCLKSKHQLRLRVCSRTKGRGRLNVLHPLTVQLLVKKCFEDQGGESQDGPEVERCNASTCGLIRGLWHQGSGNVRGV